MTIKYNKDWIVITNYHGSLNGTKVCTSTVLESSDLKRSADRMARDGLSSLLTWICWLGAPVGGKSMWVAWMSLDIRSILYEQYTFQGYLRAWRSSYKSLKTKFYLYLHWWITHIVSPLFLFFYVVLVSPYIPLDKKTCSLFIQNIDFLVSQK